MKYIRTKDGIYSYEPTHNIDVDGFVVQHNLTGWNKPLTKEDIVKITDTIEELCDEFVVDHPLFANNCKNLYHSFEKAKNGIKKRSGDAHDLFNFSIYGAIWTDKGLIYVAKMNDKGELELL